MPPHRNHHRRQNLIVKKSTWCQRRTLLEKILLVLCVLSVIVIIVLGLSLFLLNVLSEVNANLEQAEALRNVRSTSSPVAVASTTQQSANRTNDTDKSSDGEQLMPAKKCISRGCVMAASKIIEYMDESIDPCDNFYEFACGNYMKNTKIPEDKVSVDLSSTVDELVREQLQTIINEPPQRNESKPFRLAKHLNAACLNQSIIEERGIKALADILEAFGGWPVVKGDLWSGENFVWAEIVKKFRRMGLETSVFFALSVVTDLKNSTRRVLDLDEPKLELDREYLINGLDDDAVKAYYKFMVENAVVFGANRSQAEMEMREALELEIRLANITLPREERRNATALYNPYTIRMLQQSYPYLSWLDYINAFLPTGLKVKENEIAINSVPPYFEQLGNILNTTTNRTLANYLLWRAVLATSGTLTNQLREIKLDFYRTVYGIQSQEVRWKECIQYTSIKLPISVGALYVRKYFSEESRQTAIEMVNDIRSAFIDILKEVSWMDEKTRTEAIRKATSLTAHIGYPDELAENDKLEEYYRDLEIEPDDLLLNTLRIEVFDLDNFFAKLRKPVNKTDWETHSIPSIVGAYYSSLENSINFPAAILQDRYFSVDRPHYMNYASIGSVIGHEITHGFDDQGRQFDLDGNLVNWWDPMTELQFLEKANCIIEQYGNYTDLKTNLMLNGINTQGENVADNGGVKEAYFAYQKWTQRNGAEPRLPGLNKYNQQQLFWISLAQSRCSVSRDEYKENMITTGYHAPNEFRILGIIHNMPEDTFAYDFNCPSGTKMNPLKKCKVW